MIIPSAALYSEFLATPSLVRLALSTTDGRATPSLLIKTNTLLLKYIVQGAPLATHFIPLGDRLLYTVSVTQDDGPPIRLWSILEHDEEKKAVAAIAAQRTCRCYLFNELAVNVAWTLVEVALDQGVVVMAESVATGRPDYPALQREVGQALDSLGPAAVAREGMHGPPLTVVIEWHPIESHYVTNRLSRSLVDLFNRDEGKQQEQLGLWLIDGLDPRGAHLGPQIPEGSGKRELTDLLLNHEFGPILIESKTLSILAREHLPSREQLARDVSAHVDKAIRQLGGAIRSIKNGLEVTAANGEAIEVERTNPAHAIVLIPDLALIPDRSKYGLDIMKAFVKRTGGLLHILDISELLRLVQAAEMIASRGKRTTPMMAFDFALIERAKAAQKAGSLVIEVLHRLDDKAPQDVDFDESAG
ncbi:MAG: hypothetical protein IT352_17175 [Gemmatimonadales bacterium]|nr:hypothetical protein [Gemmatimonadales bacterium]